MKRFIFLLLAIPIPFAGWSQTTGYMNFTTFGVLAGTSADEKPAPLSILTEHHYRFNPAISLGLLTGIEQLNENTLPAAVNLKVFLPAAGGEFFIAGTGGYSISLEKPKAVGIKKAKGGIMAGAETGMLFRVNSGASVVIALGYRYSQLNYGFTDWWTGNYDRKISFNRISVRMGIALY